jgi:uncharacterized protein
LMRIHQPLGAKSREGSSRFGFEALQAPLELSIHRYRIAQHPEFQSIPRVAGSTACAIPGCSVEMIIAVTGASGFVGRSLTKRLHREGHQVRPVSLRNGIAADQLTGCGAVVNLAGEPVAQRWSTAARERIRSSRVESTRGLVEAMRGHAPQVLISESAIGYYGSRGDEILTETSAPAQDFLGQLSAAWEREASAALDLGVRVCCLRIGVVLGPGGGALEKMLLPFRLGLGGRLGGGAQWMSWIHIDDLTALIAFLLNESTVRGAFNAVSPHPVTNSEFTRALARTLRRPAILPVPAIALKLLLGEMSQVILASQRVIPEAALRAGFIFDYPDIFGALAKILPD